MDIKDRIELFLAQKGIKTISACESVCGLSNGAWKSKEMKESSILKFVQAFPDVNADWLLRGEGEMEILEPALKERESKVKELLGLCRSLVENYQRRDEVMAQLVSMVKNMEE